MSVLTEDSISPHAAGAPFARNTNACLAFLADHLSGAFELGSHALVGADHLVECVGDLAAETGLIWCKPHAEIAIAHRLQAPATTS